MSPPNLPGAVIMTGSPEYLEHLKQKRQAAEEMCAGLLKWLTLDIDADIKHLQEPAPVISIGHYRPSPEELIKASAEVDFIEEQMRAMEDSRQQLPKEMQALAGFALPMFQDRLRSAREFRDQIQRQLESYSGQ